MAKDFNKKILLLNKAVCRLGETLEKISQKSWEDEYRDAAIQRFEFCIELYWKVLKEILAQEEIVAVTPREVLSGAYQIDLIEGEKVWLAMLKDRNLSSHLYQEEMADQIFQKIKLYYPIMRKNLDELMHRFALDVL